MTDEHAARTEAGLDPVRDFLDRNARYDGNTRPQPAPSAPCATCRDAIINTPETADFMAGVPIEAAHQRGRWPSEHDDGKSPFDWFWLIGYLAQKAADAATRGDTDKALHHTISTAAALANWHLALRSGTNMRPGIASPERTEA